jgi:hypothetical protein
VTFAASATGSPVHSGHLVRPAVREDHVVPKEEAVPAGLLSAPCQLADAPGVDELVEVGHVDPIAHR